MILIRPMQESDLEQVSALEARNFTNPWKREDFQEALQNDRRVYVVAQKEEIIIGVCGAFLIFEEAEISNVSVEKEYCKQSIAKNMMEKIFKLTREVGIKQFTLEVRQNNLAAIALYEKLGFKTEGVRRGFYENPTEDALIMWKR